MFRVKYCRESVLKLLYQLDVLPAQIISTEELMENNADFFAKNLSPKEHSYIMTLVDYVREHREDIDAKIEENLIGWKLERLLPIDRNLLRMGIAESACDEVKPIITEGKEAKPIIIDEMIRMAKKYCGDESFKIINAILDKVIT